MKVGLIHDESKRYDGYNWHDEYASYLGQKDISYDILNFNYESCKLTLLIPIMNFFMASMACSLG